MNQKQRDYLDRPWPGWRYMWIETKDHGLSLHEVHKIQGKISWTENPVDPMPVSDVLRILADMLEDGIIFSEEELYEYNKQDI